MNKNGIYREVIRFLSDSDTYCIKAPVKIIQTHASYVFLAGRSVYKMKKPVDFGFLDYSTLKKRKFYCEKEVSLNSRFSDIYTGVLSVSITDSTLEFGEKGRVVEYVVKMKRIPERYFMKNMLRRGLISEKDINDIAGKLYDFYGPRRTRNIPDHYMKFDIAGILKQNRYLASKFIGKTLSGVTFDTINFYNESFLKVHRRLLRQRTKDGYIKDCHGDLHLEHVIIRHGRIELFDCIEFNDNFRIIDYVCDIAFLSMDLDYNGSFELSSCFTASIIKKMRDREGFSLVDFYKSYRAYVRGKVESLRSVDEGIEESRKLESHNRARKYFQLSLRYSLFGSVPVVIVVFGIIGAGKTTFANKLSDELGCVVISSDVVRKNLAGIKPTQKGDLGIYRRSMTAKTYNEMFRIGREELKKNNIVILDASFSNKKYRTEVLSKFHKSKARIYFIEVRAREKDIKERLLAREHAPSISDARLDLLEKFKANYDKPEEIPKGMLIKTNADRDIDGNIRGLFRDFIDINTNKATCSSIR